MSESNYAKQALPEWQKEHPGARVFRNNTGMAWQGKVGIDYIKTDNGDTKKLRIIENPRPVFFGVGTPKKDKETGRTKQVGGGDYIGWESKKLCSLAFPNLKYFNQVCELFKNKCSECPLNQKIAIFLNLEIKSKDGKESPDQIRFRKMVQEAGGISIVLQEGEDVR